MFKYAGPTNVVNRWPKKGIQRALILLRGKGYLGVEAKEKEIQKIIHFEFLSL